MAFFSYICLYLTSAFGEAFSVSEPEDWLLSWHSGLVSSKFDSKLSSGTSSVDSHFPSLHCALSWTFSRWTLNSTFRFVLKSHRSQQKYKYLWNSKASSWFAIWILLLSCNKWAAHHMHSQKSQGAVHKLCRLKIRGFWPPPTLISFY